MNKEQGFGFFEESEALPRCIGRCNASEECQRCKYHDVCNAERMERKFDMPIGRTPGFKPDSTLGEANGK